MNWKFELIGGIAWIVAFFYEFIVARDGGAALAVMFAGFVIIAITLINRNCQK